MKICRRVGMVLLSLLAQEGGHRKLLARDAGWLQSPGHTPPDGKPADGSEFAGTVVDKEGNPHLVGGKPWIYVDKVSVPTITVYSPGRNTGAAVLVFPGGGYSVLAIDLEGTEACSR